MGTVPKGEAISLTGGTDWDTWVGSAALTEPGRGCASLLSSFPTVSLGLLSRYS